MRHGSLTKTLATSQPMSTVPAFSTLSARVMVTSLAHSSTATTHECLGHARVNHYDVAYRRRVTNAMWISNSFAGDLSIYTDGTRLCQLLIKASSFSSIPIFITSKGFLTELA